jgi:transcriptional regulator with XRE-family HTH domain
MGQLRNEKLLKNIGKAFKKLREEKGLTQEQAFYDTGLHIGRIETAKTNLSISTINALCEYYEVSLKDFFSKNINDK